MKNWKQAVIIGLVLAVGDILLIESVSSTIARKLRLEIAKEKAAAARRFRNTVNSFIVALVLTAVIIYFINYA